MKGNLQTTSDYSFTVCVFRGGGGWLVAQLCLTLCNPMDCSSSLTRLLSPWYSPGKNTGVDSHPLLQGILFLPLHFKDVEILVLSR